MKKAKNAFSLEYLIVEANFVLFNLIFYFRVTYLYLIKFKS